MAIPPGFARIGLVFKHNLDPDPWVTTFGVGLADYPAPTDIEQIGQDAMIAWWNPWRGDTSDEVTLLGADVSIGQDGAPLSAFVDGVPGNTPSTTGGTSSAKLPQNCALLVRKQTALGGRQGKGRMFVPGVLNEAGVDGVGQISVADRAAWAANCNSFFGNLGSSFLPMHILHESGTVTSPTPCTGVTVDPIISTQRRRLR